jgi:hypothetical protein
LRFDAKKSRATGLVNKKYLQNASMMQDKTRHVEAAILAASDYGFPAVSRIVFFMIRRVHRQ